MSRPAHGDGGHASRLVLHGVTKRFGPLTAVAPLDLTLPAGSIHALLGENGAGKSTIVRLVAGVFAPDAGRIEIDGGVVAPGDPRSARAAGVGVVHQHFALIGALSVAENLLLGRAEDTRRIVRPADLVREAEELAAEHGLDIGDPRAACATLPVGTLARIEILRALAGTPRVLLLDEPTAVLTPAEIDELFDTLRRLRDSGMLVVLVTHKLDEALALCDAATVLRGGRVVAQHPLDEVTAGELARTMVGAEAASPVSDIRSDAQHLDEDVPALEVRDLATGSRVGRTTLAHVSLSIDPGEILGIAGVDGNGQHELADALAGVDARAGTVVANGETVRAGDVAHAHAAGIALIPSDRQRDGLALDLSVTENLLLAAPLLDRFSTRGLIDAPGARRFAERLTDDYRVALASVDQPVGALSGGNQQRIVIGRTLAMEPRVLIATNPTRGLDIAATTHVHATLRRVAATGTAVLLISTDLDELLALATRIQVLYRGRLSASVDTPARETLGRLMAGLDA